VNLDEQKQYPTFHSESSIAINCADENCFQFSKSETVSLHFSQLHLANTYPDLKLYGTMQQLRHNLSLLSCPCHPAFSCVFGIGFRRLFKTRPNIMPTLDVRMHQNVLDSGKNLAVIAINSTPYIPCGGC